MRMMSISSRLRKRLKHSSISVMLVSVEIIFHIKTEQSAFGDNLLLSMTMKLGCLFLFISPIPPRRNPTHVSSSPITAMSLPLAAAIAILLFNYGNTSNICTGKNVHKHQMIREMSCDNIDS